MFSSYLLVHVIFVIVEHRLQTPMILGFFGRVVIKQTKNQGQTTTSWMQSEIIIDLTLSNLHQRQRILIVFDLYTDTCV